MRLHAEKEKATADFHEGGSPHWPPMNEIELSSADFFYSSIYLTQAQQVVPYMLLQHMTSTRDFVLFLTQPTSFVFNLE